MRKRAIVDRARKVKAVQMSKLDDSTRTGPRGESNAIIGPYRRPPRGALAPRAFRRGLGVQVGYTPGQLTRDPREAVAWMIRNALSPRHRKRPDVTVYDAHGTPVAIIDGETRERRPIPKEETR